MVGKDSLEINHKAIYLPGERAIGMSDEIKMPEGIAEAVVDAIEAMADEGKWFDDPEQGEKLLAYLREYHPKITEQSWCLKTAARTRGDDGFKSFVEKYYPGLQEIPDYIIHRASELVANNIKGKGVEVAYLDDMGCHPMTEEQEKRIAMIISGEDLPTSLQPSIPPSEPAVNTKNNND
jgi:hypothetical protein